MGSGRGRGCGVYGGRGNRRRSPCALAPVGLHARGSTATHDDFMFLSHPERNIQKTLYDM